MTIRPLRHVAAMLVLLLCAIAVAPRASAAAVQLEDMTWTELRERMNRAVHPRARGRPGSSVPSRHMARRGPARGGKVAPCTEAGPAHGQRVHAAVEARAQGVIIR